MRWWVMEFEQKWLFDYFLGIRRAPKNLRVIDCKFGGCVDTTNSYNLYLQIYLQIVQNFLQIWICVDTLIGIHRRGKWCKAKSQRHRAPARQTGIVGAFHGMLWAAPTWGPQLCKIGCKWAQNTHKVPLYWPKIPNIPLSSLSSNHGMMWARPRAHYPGTPSYVWVDVEKATNE